MSDRTPQSQDKYIIRFPDGMREHLKDQAEIAGRSLNAEIVHRLWESLNAERDDRLKLKLPWSVETNLRADAGATGRTIEEQATAVLLKYSEDLEAVVLDTSKSRDLQSQLDEYKLLLKQKDGLLMAVCLQIYLHRDQLPADALFMADAILKQSGELDLLNLQDNELVDVPEARFHALVRRFFKNSDLAKPKKKASSAVVEPFQRKPKT